MLRRLLNVLNLVLGCRLNSRLRMRLAWPECSLDGFTARACKIFIASSERAEGLYCGQWLWHVGRWEGGGYWSVDQCPWSWVICVWTGVLVMGKCLNLSSYRYCTQRFSKLIVQTTPMMQCKIIIRLGGRSITIISSVCVSVCLSVREHISRTVGSISTKVLMQVNCGCGSVLLWRRCDMLCTSGFMDDVTFGRMGSYGDALRCRGGSLVMSMNALFF